MQQAKRLADQINKALTELGAPPQSRERTTILSKMLDISKQEAWVLLEGQVFPDEAILKQISQELEIDINKKNINE